MLKRRNNIPGFQEGGTNVDPVSGNEVPMGSLPEEVRDDVDAKLSPGEFVIPADVVRFIGLERLMKMRDEAKKGLERMAAIGQMGNAEEVGEESNSTYEDEGFESEVDDILEEIEAEENGKGDAGEQTEKMMAAGGFIGSGTDLTKAPKNPVFDVRYYKNDQGTVMYITHINGKPMSPVPEGFKLVTKEEAQKVGLAAEEAKKAEQKPAAGAGAVTGQEGPGIGLEDTSAANVAALQAGSTSGLQTGTTVPTGAVQAAGAVGAMLGIPGATALMTKGQQIAAALTNMSGVQAGKANIENMGKAFGLDTSTTEGQAAASSLIDSLSSTLGGPAATSGPSGTGGAAASAASSAGTAAAAAGHSQGAIGAAAQAAANAVIGGATPAEAAQAGADAAAAAEASGEGAAVGVGGSVSDGPGSGGGPDDGSFAKGGLVNRRQYPAKKKRGKGIIAQK